MGHNELKRLTPDEYMIQQSQEVIDFTVNGECSGCGGCCSNRIPLSDDELRSLRRLVKKKKLKPISHVKRNIFDKGPIIDMMCPFLDENFRCTIYEFRPKMCEVFKCNKTTSQLLGEFLQNSKLDVKYKPRMLREELFK
jgi:Fe-S-cluster containining protein